MTHYEFSPNPNTHCLFKVPGILPPQEVITIAIGMNDVLKVLKFTIMLGI